MVGTYYRNLYTKEPRLTLGSGWWTFPTLGRSSLWWLNRQVTGHEVRIAVQQLGKHKAPGPDGLPALFFQRFWPVVGEAITNFIFQVFRTGVIPEGMNDSLITLIPKCEQPVSITQFRPICLSNVIIKVVSKVLANRLKPLMAVLVGREQSSFIPGRHTTDNIVIVQEALHSFKRKKGKKGAMIAKIDLEKAHDRIDWTFLQEVLCSVGLDSAMITVIMGCLHSTRISVLWNGEWLDSFISERGLQQGDPLSPYLFVLCMEVLGNTIRTAVQQGTWKACRLSRGGPALSHLYFADDLLLFGDATPRQARVMADILETFCHESGQCMNISKSRLWLPPHLLGTNGPAIRREFGVPLTSDLGLYLGAPLLHGRHGANNY